MHGTETIAEAGPYPYTSPMTATLIGYARCSTDRQDPAAQRQALLALGVVEDRIYTDHGLAGTTRARPGPRPGALRPGRSHGKAVLQYPRHLRRVQSRSHPQAHSRGHGHRPARGNCAASSPNCPTDRSGNSAAGMPPASIPSAISPSSAPSPDQPPIAHSTDPIPLSVRSCPLPESTRTSRWRRRCAPACSKSPGSPHRPSPTSRRGAFGSQRPFSPTLVLTLCRI